MTVKKFRAQGKKGNIYERFRTYLTAVLWCRPGIPKLLILPSACRKLIYWHLFQRQGVQNPRAITRMLNLFSRKAKI